MKLFELKQIIREEMDNLLSEGLKFHLKNKIRVNENIFRPGSTKYFELFAEVRKLSQGGLYKLNEEEKYWINETDIGEFVIFEGERVFNAVVGTGNRDVQRTDRWTIAESHTLKIEGPSYEKSPLRVPSGLPVTLWKRMTPSSRPSPGGVFVKSEVSDSQSVAVKAVCEALAGTCTIRSV